MCELETFSSRGGSAKYHIDQWRKRGNCTVNHERLLKPNSYLVHKFLHVQKIILTKIKGLS